MNSVEIQVTASDGNVVHDFSFEPIQGQYTDAGTVEDTAEWGELLLQELNAAFGTDNPANVYEIIGIVVFIDGDEYSMPSFPTAGIRLEDGDKIESFFDDVHYMYETLTDSKMNIPRCYMALCLHKDEVLSMRQFDQCNGGEVPSARDYALELIESGAIEVEDWLIPYINLEDLGNDQMIDRETTDEDEYTGQSWFVD